VTGGLAYGKAENLHYDLGTENFSYQNQHFLTGGGLFVVTGLTSSAKFAGDIARVGLNYQFH
jgi:hypothetical protein